MANDDPFNQILSGWQGDPLPWQVTALQSDGVTPMDVSLWIVMFTVKANYTDTDDQAIYRYDVQMPAASTAGVLSGELPDTVTQTMAPASYKFDVRVIIPPSSKPQRIYAGQIAIGKSVGTRITPYNLVVLT
jgi:hypothetical protein